MNYEQEIKKIEERAELSYGGAIPGDTPDLSYSYEELLTLAKKMQVELREVVRQYVELEESYSLLSKAKFERWIPCSEKLPENGTHCFVTYEGREVDTSIYNAIQEDWKPSSAREVIAWMPLPEPWKITEDGLYNNAFFIKSTLLLH